MKVVFVHGQDHKGSTYQLAHLLVEKAFDDPEVTEFFLPKDSSDFCTGCCTCITVDETKCPHRKNAGKIIEAIIAADVVVFDSPTYCWSVTGQLKAFLDHMVYLWMSHRPDPSMFGKIGIAVSTCAGKGDEYVTKFLDQQMMMVGISARYQLGAAIAADSWEHISDKKREELEEETDKLAKKIRTSAIKPDAKLKVIYSFMRKNQLMNEWNPVDRGHWEKNGWLDGKKPW